MDKNETFHILHVKGRRKPQGQQLDESHSEEKKCVCPAVESKEVLLSL